MATSSFPIKYSTEFHQLLSTAFPLNDLTLSGQPQGSTIVLNSGAGDSTAGELPKVAMDAGGDFTIAFQGYDASSLGIFAQQFNSSGVSQGAIFRVNTPNQTIKRAPTDRDGFRRGFRDRLAPRMAAR